EPSPGLPMRPAGAPLGTAALAIGRRPRRPLGGALSLLRLPQLPAREPLQHDLRVLLLQALEGRQQIGAVRRTARGRRIADEDRPVRVARWHQAIPSSLFSFSTSVVRFMFNTCAAAALLPPVRSSARLITSRSMLPMNDSNEMPSSGSLRPLRNGSPSDAIWMSGGRSEASTRGRPPDNATAASPAFSACRTLPGQAYTIRQRSAGCDTVMTGLPCSPQYFCRKCWTSSGTSSLRSRSAGSETGITCSR